jgi:hypothetical protein
LKSSIFQVIYFLPGGSESKSKLHPEVALHGSDLPAQPTYFTLIFDRIRGYEGLFPGPEVSQLGLEVLTRSIQPLGFLALGGQLTVRHPVLSINYGDGLLGWHATHQSAGS